MLAFPRMLMLSPKTIDKKFISPLRNSDKYKLNEWRNIFSQAIGFKSFHEMTKRNVVLLDFQQALKVVDNSTKLKYLMWQEATWYIPYDDEVQLCIRLDVRKKCLSPEIYEFQRNTFRDPNYKYFSIGNVCISKESAKYLIDIESESLKFSIEDNLLDEFYISPPLPNFDPVNKKRTPYDYWSNHYGTAYEDRQALVKCKTMRQLYAALCDYIGGETGETFGDWGFTIAEFIEEILYDEDCEIPS